jgi:hypothetical protein
LECFLDVAEIFTFCGHACGGERAADPLNGPGINGDLPDAFGNTRLDPGPPEIAILIEATPAL